MSRYLRAKIKDRDQFKQVFPLPKDSADAPEVGKFILSIIGQTISVEKLRSKTGSFYYTSDLDSRWVIMPSWIEYFDTHKLVLTDSCVEQLILDDGTVVIIGGSAI
jgi:hypothetical protein